MPQVYGGVNELADFHVDIRYRPGKANADADTLSRMPVSFEDYMKSCSEVVNRDVLDAITFSIHETNTVQTAWLSSLTAVPDMLKEEHVDIPTMPHDELMTPGCRQSAGTGERAFLLAVHESRHHPLCHKSVPLPEATKTCDSR